ncbi:MAG: EAL domain-containing protein, partial [Pseudomonadota bacterium]
SPQVKQLFADFQAYGDVENYETTITTKSGEEREIQWHSSNRFDEHGNILEIVGIGEDITERKLAEQELKRSEARLAEAQRVAHFGSWEMDLEKNSVYWTEEALRLFEVDDARKLESYEDCVAAVHPDDRDAVHNAFSEAIEFNRSYDIIFRLAFEDDRVRHLRSRCEVLYDDQRNPLRTIGTIQDVTQQINQEERLRSMLHATKQLEEYNDHIVQNSPSFIAGVEPGGRTISINDAGCRISGYPKSEIVGKNFWKTVYPGDKYVQVEQLFADFEKYGVLRNYETVIETRSGEIRTISWASANRYDEYDNLLEVIMVGEDVTELKRSQQELENLAHRDVLTGLPNRLYFQSRLEGAIKRAKRTTTSGAVLFIDLDRFKNINDSLGHQAGDTLLNEVAERLKRCVRQDDTVARIGGDEFTLLIEGVDPPENAEVVANKVLDAFRAPFKLDRHDYHVTPSIGISLFPRDGVSIDTLLRNADTAMYEAKNRGRNAFAIYTESLTSAARERIELENNLRRALERQEFFLCYQPQLDLLSGEMIGAESLIRWQHPDHGLVSPAQFIPIAEESGLIVDIGRWVLETACMQARNWYDSGLRIGRIAVNVSGQQISRGNLVETCQAALEQSGLPANMLELEVTETFIMNNTEGAIEELNRLKDIGIFLSIDDFGTGYSSLAYLKRLPVDVIKIDQSFVRDIPHDLDDAAITRAVIALGNSLRLDVLAEGVETEDQRQFLLRDGCTKGQGYLFSKPLIANEFRKFTESFTAAASTATRPRAP